MKLFLPKFSVIVAVGSNFGYIDKCAKECLKLPELRELFVVPDVPLPKKYPDKRVKIVVSGKIPPGEKRDLVAKKASGKFLAFIDDDAYPSKQWLSEAEKLFADESVAAAGGPAVTAPEDSFLQRASGFVYSSPLCSGGYDLRYVPRKLQECDDIPSVNLIVRKTDFEKAGGFGSKYWPGEDTKLCHDLALLGKKLVYSPKVLVYHHRRGLFLAHLGQVKNYAFHRGFFAKKFPKTSLRPAYFLPTLMLLAGFGFAALSFYVAFFAQALALLAAIYLGASFAFGFSKEGVKMGAYVALGTLLTHIVYGIYFPIGLLSPTRN